MTGGRWGDTARNRRRSLHGGLLVLVTVAGAMARLPGVDRSGLYFDDAWFALPARVSLREALALVVTAPGYTLVQREWIVLGPSGNVWPKVLSFILGVASIPIMYLVARRLHFQRWLSLAMAGLLAVSPAAIEYSVRVKEYEGDLILAAVVLVIAEGARRQPATRRLVVFGLVSVAAVSLSTSLVVVVAGCWAAVLVDVLVERSAPLRVAAVGLVTAVLCAVPTVWVATRLPPRLTAFWRENNHLVGGPYSLHHAALLLSALPSGFAHGLVGTPLGQSSVVFGHSAVGALASVVGIVVLAVAASSVIGSFRPGADRAGRVGLSSLLTLLVAVLLWLSGSVPLGTGRTDLVLYPSVAILGGLTARDAISMLRRWSMTRRVAPSIIAGTAIALSVAGVLVAWQSQSWYPAQDVSSLPAATSWQHHPDTAALVTERNSFTWAFDQLSSFTVHVNRTDPASSTIGFWVTFTSPRVLEQVAVATGSGNHHPTTSVVPGLAALPPEVTKLWLFVPTASTFSPSSGRVTGPSAQRVVPSRAMVILANAGWHRTDDVEHAPGVAAILYRR